jgi:hypothetical protein
MLSEISECGLFSFEISSFFVTQCNEIEFFVSLRKLSDSLSSKEKAERFRASITQCDLQVNAAQEILKYNGNHLVQQLEEQLQAIKASRSWRVTAPLRTLSALSSRLFTPQRTRN